MSRRDRPSWACILALLIATPLAAIEVAATVARHVDGDTIRVRLMEGLAPLPVRLLWIDTPEHVGRGRQTEGRRLSSAAIKDLIPTGSAVTLWGPGDDLKTDRWGRILALVIAADGRIVQLEMIHQGWSPYWRKYSDAPAPWHQRLLDAEQQSQTAGAGLWSLDPDWMARKAAERPGS